MPAGGSPSILGQAACCGTLVVIRTQLPPKLLGLLAILGTGAALAAEPAIVVVGGAPIAKAALWQAIERCNRDAADLPLAECVRRYQVPLWRLDRAAREDAKTDAPVRRAMQNGILAERLIETFLAESSPGDDALQAYLDQHRADFETPERVRIFRILVKTRADAQRLIGELGRAAVADFRAAARAQSLDRSSHERGGDLGFVAADGTTDVPGIRVDPGLFTAVHGLPDGAFASEPVAEGEAFAVVWRRGSLPARTMEPGPARALAQKRLAELGAQRKLDELVAAHPSERHVDLLARLKRAECQLFRP